MPIRHQFHATAPDNDSDPAGVVQPSHFNADHEITGLLAQLDALGAGVNMLIYLGATGQASTAAFSPKAQEFLAALTSAAMLTVLGAAPLASPALTGTPTAPTAVLGTNTTQIATMAALKAMRDDLLAGAPGALDTLNELASALGNDANFSATVSSSLANRLRFDAVQSLTTGQKAQAVANLGLPTFGTAASLNVGTGASQIVQLDGSAKLPALDGSQLINLPTVAATIPRGWIDGLTLSPQASTTTFGVAAGQAADSTNTVMMSLAAAVTKTGGAWVQGSGLGALDTGSLVANTFYQALLIEKTDKSAVDVLIAKTGLTPVMPTGWTFARRIGWLKTSAAVQWLPVMQVQDEFHYAAMVQDLTNASVTTASQATTLSVPPGGVEALMRLGLSANSNGVLVTSLDENDVAPFSAGNGSCTIWSQGTGGFINGEIRKRTDSIARIRWVGQAAGGTFSIATYGWIDKRGRNA